jgi:hypothetical protein
VPSVSTITFALGIEQLHVQAELLEKAPLDRQVKVKKVEALARIADEDLLPYHPGSAPEASARTKMRSSSI